MKSKTTKKIVLIDLFIQLLIIGTSIWLAAFSQQGYYFFVGFYFILGGWQLLSFFIHLKRRLKNLDGFRFYSKSIAFTFIAGLPCFMIYITNMEFVFYYWFLYAVFMFFFGPFLALFYLVSTYNEYNKKV